MSVRADYTDEEWLLLRETPPLAAAAVMRAADAGWAGGIAEALELREGTEEALVAFQDEPLIRALFLEGEGMGPAEDHALADHRDPAIIREDALERCRIVRQILAARATPSEAQAYCIWTLGTCEKVALAARHGGFLGIGGHRVTQAEHDLLQAIAEAIGFEGYQAPAPD